MTKEQITWEDALANSSKFVKLPEGQRVILIAKNPTFAKIEKEFKGQEPRTFFELTLDVVQEDDAVVEKILTTISKRFLTQLKPLFAGVAADVEVKFSVKKIGTGTDTAFDVEKL